MKTILIAVATVMLVAFSGTKAEASSLMATPFAAQVVANIKNPTAVQFTASVDHALIDGYDLDILRADGTVLQTINLAKPSVATDGTCTVAVNVQPIAFGTNYSGRVRARAGTAFSDYANSLNNFDRVPGSPSKLIYK